jgi:uncharacterized protein with von Willebrand factor type A (vWA) domain
LNCHGDIKEEKNPNKQIMMITDGNLRIKIGKKYYQNSFGLDKKILTRCFALAVKYGKQGIPITTFMIARDHGWSSLWISLLKPMTVHLQQPRRIGLFYFWITNRTNANSGIDGIR